MGTEHWPQVSGPAWLVPNTEVEALSRAPTILLSASIREAECLLLPVLWHEFWGLFSGSRLSEAAVRRKEP